MLPEPRALRALPSRLCALAATLLMGACAGSAPPPVRPPAPAPAPSPALPASAPVAPPAPPVAPPPTAAPAAAVEPAVAMPVYGGLPGAVRSNSGASYAALLAYGERLRRMPPPELSQELARLTDIPDNLRLPGDDMQLAMALGHTRAPADLQRAQALLQRVLANPREEVRALHPLAGLLAARYAEQRRVEDALDRQSQQIKEQQRRIDQLNERLEAVRAIERSLTARPAPANGASAPRATP